MFESYIERPVFNLLEILYALIPGHDLGLAIVIFTIIIRLLLYPVVRKQLHHQKAMRRLRPEIKKIKQAAGKDRQKQARLQSELFKEHGIKPFSAIGTAVLQLPIFLALFFSIRKLINDPNALQTFSYDWVHDLSWIQQLAADISNFEHTLFGIVDLSRHGLSGGIYPQAVALGLLAAFVQYHQTKQLLPDSKDSQKLSDILKQTAGGKQTDQAELGDAVGRGMLYIVPPATFIGIMAFPMALGLYVITSSAVGYFQQRHVLGKDVEEMTEIASETITKVEILPAKNQKPKTKNSKRAPTKKRRR